jgi:hypothetical protein
MESNLDYLRTESNTRQKEIAPGVWVVCCEYLFCNHVQEQYVEGDDLYLYMELPTAEKILSKKAIRSGDIEGNRLYFSAPYRYAIPLYELLENRYITDYDIIRNHDMEESVRDGAYHCPDYFGSLEGTVHSRDSQPVGKRQVANGIYAFTYADGGVELAVHEVVAFNDLSDVAEGLGQNRGVYFHFQDETCAIPIRELATIHPALEGLIDDNEGMNQIIEKKFPAYVAWLDNLKPKDGDGDFLEVLFGEG